MIELKEQIKVVAKARGKAQELADYKCTLMTQWEEKNKALLGDVVQANEQQAEAEAKLRELTLQAYAETGNKAPAEGVSVKIFQVLSYDRGEAMKWASEHRVALKLDSTTFEKIAKVDKPSFVTISDEPRAQIAQSLG